MDMVNGVGYTRDLDEYKAFADVQKRVVGAFGNKPVSLGIDGLWFNMLACGWKKEEYREIKPFNDARMGMFLKPYGGGLLLLTNGMQPDSQRMALRFEKIEKGIGRAEWGAPNEPVYRIFIERVLFVYRPERLCNRMFRYAWHGGRLNVGINGLGKVVLRFVTEK